MTKIADVMTKNPIALQADSSVLQAAKKMREADVGPILVMRDGQICGTVTDRDITIRAVAEGKDPSSMKLSEIVSKEKLQTCSPNDDVDDAVRMMREKAIRRLPVVKDGEPVGIVSLGDLAQNKDPGSVLGRVSAAEPNK